MTFEIDPNLIENNEVRLTEDGSGDLAIEHVPSGNTITVDQDVAISDIATDKLPSNLDAQGNDINNVGSLSTVEETVTGETLIRARRANSVTGISANEWTNIADTELDDNRDELNGLTINVDKDGFYHLFAAVHFLNVADGDRIDFALRNTSSSSLVDLTRDPRQIAAGSEDGMDINTVVKLSSGVDYEVQARSIDGSFDIIEPSYFSLVRSLVQP